MVGKKIIVSPENIEAKIHGISLCLLSLGGADSTGSMREGTRQVPTYRRGRGAVPNQEQLRQLGSLLSL